MKLRDRIKELKRVPAREIENAPWNFRTHSAGQVDALRGSFEEIGFFDALEVWEPGPGRLMLIDGEARSRLIGAEVDPDWPVPVVVTDLTEAEARKALAIKDPLAEMAGTDPAKLNDLLHDIHTESEALAKMLDDMAMDAGVVPSDADANGDADAVDIPVVYNVVVTCRDEIDQKQFYDRMQEEDRKCRVLTV